MILFQNDYNQACHPQILKKITEHAFTPMPGYGEDPICEHAADLIRKACENNDLSVHFLVGGTQTNLTVIASALKPYQAVIAPSSGHISEHETGAIEATGHKIIELPSSDGKLRPEQIEQVMLNHLAGNGPGREHTPQPKMVYISDSTEYGTVYSLEELEALGTVCKKNGLYLFLDGARLGYALMAKENNASIADVARICDVFYIGGTKAGTMFGEAVVIRNSILAEDFRYMIKQRGGMLAKGWLLGLQFEALFENGLYFDIGRTANQFADQIRETLVQLKYPLTVDCGTNQVFAVMPDSVLDILAEEFVFTEMGRADKMHRTVRFCTSWSTTQEQVDALCCKIKELSV